MIGGGNLFPLSKVPDVDLPSGAHWERRNEFCWCLVREGLRTVDFYLTDDDGLFYRVGRGRGGSHPNPEAALAYVLEHVKIPRPF